MIYGITNNAQFVPLVWSVLLGVVSGVLWDILRFFRRLLPCGKVCLFFEDVLFFTVWSFLTFMLCYVTNFGIIRAYILLAQPFGFFLWYCLPGKLTFRIADGVSALLRRIVFYPYFRLCCAFCRFSFFVKRTRNKEIREKHNKNLNNNKKNIPKLQKKTCKQYKDIV